MIGAAQKGLVLSATNHAAAAAAATAAVAAAAPASSDCLNAASLPSDAW